MIKLTQNTKTFGDCTAGYAVTLDKQYTVGEFIKEVLTKGEWGKIGILDENQSWFEAGNPFCEYKRNEIITEMPIEYIDKIIINVTARGGWSNMDYILTL